MRPKKLLALRAEHRVAPLTTLPFTAWETPQSFMDVPPQQAAGPGKTHLFLPPEPDLPDFVARPMRASALRILLVLSCLVPLVVLAIAGWRSWEFERAEATDRAAATLGVVEEHVRKVLDTQVLVLDWLRDRIGGSSWDEIERSQPLYKLLALLDNNYAQVDGIFLIDAAGRVRMNSHEFPLKRMLMLADRDYFQALSKGGGPLFISGPYVGRWNGAFSFRVAQPLLATDGTFRGVVALSVHVEYFERFFQSAVGSTGGTVTLMRDDGRVLAAFPSAASAEQREGWTPSARQKNENVRDPPSSTSAAGGLGQLTMVRVVDGYPVVLTRHIPQSVIFAEWSKHFAVYGVVALISACILSSVTYIAIRGQRREGAAVAAWQREQLQRLGAESDARRLSKYEALGTLAGGIAHHFNNLFPALTGHLEIAMEEAGVASPARPRLRRLLDEVGGARKIIRDILLFSRREISAFRPFDLGAVAAQSVDMFRVAIANTAELKTAIQPGVYVLGDAAQLSQLVANLLSNAYDALGPTARNIVLTVGTSAGLEPSGRATSRPYARLVCADTGSGMSAEVLERAFDPFFTTKPPGSGSGLGLSICDGIIRSHGGRVSVESAEGRGTTITVILPLATQGAS